MAKLPFIVEPRIKPAMDTIGTDESGKIEIERRGFLTAAEKAFTQAQSTQDEVTQDMVKLCRKIGQECKIDMQKAYTVLSECMQSEGDSALHEKVLEAFQEEMSEIVTAMAAASSRTMVLNALCMLLYRVDAEFDVSEVMNLHPDILEGLDQLYRDEESRSTDRLMELLEVDASPTSDQIDALEKK